MASTRTVKRQIITQRATITVVNRISGAVREVVMDFNVNATKNHMLVVCKKSLDKTKEQPLNVVKVEKIRTTYIMNEDTFKAHAEHIINE